MEKPSMVRSIVLSGFGGYDKIKMMQSPLKAPAEDELEVTVNYCALNFADIYMRAGLIRTLTPPFTLGIECSGRVTALGPQTDSQPWFKVGDRVVCYSVLGGMHCEKIVISKKNCYLLPEEITLEEGAGIFVTYMTAYFSVIRLGNLQPLENILIHSCAGGVGWAATQLAQTIEGVKVIGTTSLFKHDAVKENGVNHVFEYANHIQKVKALSPKGVDLILENQAGIDFTESRNLLKPLGRIIILGANNLIESHKQISAFDRFMNWMRTKPLHPVELINESRSVAGVNLYNLTLAIPGEVRKTFEVICQLVIEGKLKPRIDSKWQFHKVIDATKVLGERRNVGKVILVIKEEEL